MKNKLNYIAAIGAAFLAPNSSASAPAESPAQLEVSELAGLNNGVFKDRLLGSLNKTSSRRIRSGNLDNNESTLRLRRPTQLEGDIHAQGPDSTAVSVKFEGRGSTYNYVGEDRGPLTIGEVEIVEGQFQVQRQNYREVALADPDSPVPLTTTNERPGDESKAIQHAIQGRHIVTQVAYQPVERAQGEFGLIEIQFNRGDSVWHELTLDAGRNLNPNGFELDCHDDHDFSYGTLALELRQELGMNPVLTEEEREALTFAKEPGIRLDTPQVPFQTPEAVVITDLGPSVDEYGELYAGLQELGLTHILADSGAGFQETPISEISSHIVRTEMSGQERIGRDIVGERRVTQSKPPAEGPFQSINLIEEDRHITRIMHIANQDKGSEDYRVTTYQAVNTEYFSEGDFWDGFDGNIGIVTKAEEGWHTEHIHEYETRTRYFYGCGPSRADHPIKSVHQHHSRELTFNLTYPVSVPTDQGRVIEPVACQLELGHLDDPLRNSIDLSCGSVRYNDQDHRPNLTIAQAANWVSRQMAGEVIHVDPQIIDAYYRESLVHVFPKTVDYQRRGKSRQETVNCQAELTPVDGRYDIGNAVVSCDPINRRTPVHPSAQEVTAAVSALEDRIAALHVTSRK